MFYNVPREILAIAVLASVVGQYHLFKYFEFSVTL